MAKATTKASTVKSVEAKGKQVAKEAAFNPWMERLTRLGYAVKGFLYVAIGFIAIAGALGKSKTPADQLGAIQEFSKLPYAGILLWVILLGLISYSLWGVIRAALDPFHKGNDLKGLLTRGGYLLSAVTYAHLCDFDIPFDHRRQRWSGICFNCQDGQYSDEYDHGALAGWRSGISRDRSRNSTKCTWALRWISINASSPTRSPLNN